MKSKVHFCEVRPKLFMAFPDIRHEILLQAIVIHKESKSLQASQRFVQRLQMSSRLAPDEKICSVRELICSVNGRVCCASLWRGLTNLSPCLWNFSPNQCVGLDRVFVSSDG